MKAVGRVLCALAGLFFVGFGIYFLVRPGVALASVAVILGISAVVYGIFAIISYFSKEKVPGAGWLLFDGIVSVLFGILMWCTPMVAFVALMLPYLLSFWVLFKGLAVFMRSFDLKAINVPGWGWSTALGVICVLLAFVLIFNPLLTTVLFGTMVAVALIFFGIASIAQVFAAPKVQTPAEQ